MRATPYRVHLKVVYTKKKIKRSRKGPMPIHRMWPTPSKRSPALKNEASTDSQFFRLVIYKVSYVDSRQQGQNLIRLADVVPKQSLVC